LENPVRLNAVNGAGGLKLLILKSISLTLLASLIPSGFSKREFAPTPNYSKLELNSPAFRGYSKFHSTK